MEIVIDIPEGIYKTLRKNSSADIVRQAVIGGAPLPKGHGRLIDADVFIAKVNKDRAHSCYIESWTANDVLNRLQQDYAPTIIEADKENEK